MTKKVILMFLICVLALGNCFAEIMGSRFKVTESEKEFDVLYYLTKDMKVADNNQNEDVNVTQTFSINRENINAEVRYSLFTDIGEDDSDLRMQFAMLVFINELFVSTILQVLKFQKMLSVLSMMPM